MSRSTELRALFDEHYSYVLRTLVRLGVAERDAEDAAQELFLAVHGKLAELDRSRPVRPWLFGFAARIASNYRRREARRGRSTADRAPLGIPGRDPEVTLDRAQQSALLRRALEVLDLPKRTVLVAHDLDEISGPEIAAVLSIPLNTVYSRLHEARRLLQSEARRLLREGER